MAQPGASVRPRFSPSPGDTYGQIYRIPTPLISNTEIEQWVPVISCPADFPLELFETAVDQLIHHPEYNSTLILRSETISETSYTEDNSSGVLQLEGYRPVHNIHRRLLPRRPGRDTALEQNCTLYASATDEFAAIPSTLVLTPLLARGESLPYYHPNVRHLAFRYIPSTPATLRIEAIVLPQTPIDLNSRLYRTSLALLDTLHRYGWGALTNYQKRVKHDCIIPREEYQDLYLVMRERYKHLVGEWKEVTDPLKHIFEDIGIATYLILLWKKSFEGSNGSFDNTASDSDPPWKRLASSTRCIPRSWVSAETASSHIFLVSEGYEGHGIDLRARTSWSHYPESTRAALHVNALRSDPIHQDDIPYLRPGVFLIGNHADELTPGSLSLRTLENASGYLSIPCCSWSFDERFSRSSTAKFSDSNLGSIVDDTFVDGLNLGGEGANRTLSQWLGWKVECDTLRIPSTRNWAIIGMSRALDIIHDVVQRGAFKTRQPEGKAGDH
ncbi:hypothetical protein BU15DRAFT_87642 [Melanogaster broomeanus]|nr:hypothetical protein BU15DRAFT_87642 [Melanogaster broomeanus]